MEQNQNIGPRYAIRLADLRDWHVVTATCFCCGRRGTITVATLIRGRPGYTRLIDLKRKLDRVRESGREHINVGTARRSDDDSGIIEPAG